LFFGTAPPVTFHRIAATYFDLGFTLSILADVKVMLAGHVFSYDDIDEVDMIVVFFLQI
jgi:hypothetical protein